MPHLAPIEQIAEVAFKLLVGVRPLWFEDPLIKIDIAGKGRSHVRRKEVVARPGIIGT